MKTIPRDVRAEDFRELMSKTAGMTLLKSKRPRMADGMRGWWREFWFRVDDPKSAKRPDGIKDEWWRRGTSITYSLVCKFDFRSR